MPSGRSNSVPKISPSTVGESALGRYRNYMVDLGGFGEFTAGDANGNQITRTRWNPAVQGILDKSQSGLSSNLGFLGRTPTQQLEDIDAGYNTYYNLQAELNRRLNEEQLGQAQLRYSQSGLENSTARGAFEGQLATDALLRDLATRTESINSQNNLALNNGNFQNQVMQGLAGIAMGNMGMANSNFVQGKMASDQINMFDAGQTQQANQLNAQMQLAQQQAAAQRKSSMMGNLISGGLSLAAIPLTGGLSGLGMLGGLGGGLASGGAAAAALGSLPGVSGLSQSLASNNFVLKDYM